MDNRKIKSFSRFMEEQFPPPVVANPPTNTASGSFIAGLPPDMPPMRQRKANKIMGRRKKAV